MRKKKRISAVEIRKFSSGTNLFFNIFLAIFALSCILPFVFIIILSLTKESDITLYGYQFWPKHWGTMSYVYLAKMGKQVLTSLGVTVFITVVGTIINSLFSSTYAYAISRKDFAYAKFFTIFALISMLFVPGMVPTYLVITQMLGLKDNIWALILPMSFGVYNVLIMRSFFKTSIPEAIIESARIDGASELRIFRSIVVPLAIPGIATISLFTSLGYWNDWMNALLYITDDKLVPLQYLLVKIQNNIQVMTQQMNSGGSAMLAQNVPAEGMRFAVVVVATLPIALTYPFFQKYFVKGMTIGGVKG
ncbi:carbohydrate ABC transporter permease [Latilactobacillus fuchuensis]|uniref:Carbohydrate abc superfamily atp binding cassette transporter, membrane protein n=1 Tax=Latilactobacillus fuchuensis DSM 14340 = JCM 11249 TaxID=1423747 RepID=A0A0R1S595_9LACO|nr:carbohydrate ABC transporter permease [Latilactobacillus fuchuensis]KRL61573.1 carbohydrate abc superfamily atp binding cassette transporter, membrane protein [Latilactobacillus fuchuensis DSM 14340 = JCM 11249]MCP8857640.1 carbohydrate ABC transporter permease [Latilactobacillus fuchuensis]